MTSTRNTGGDKSEKKAVAETWRGEVATYHSGKRVAAQGIYSVNIQINTLSRARVHGAPLNQICAREDMF